MARDATATVVVGYHGRPANVPFPGARRDVSTLGLHVTYSFPSGHAANAAAAATVMVLLLWPLLSPAARRWLVAGLGAFVVVTMLDRVFLDVHFPSDVVAGALFGVGLATASYAGYLGWNPTHPDGAPAPEGRSGPEPTKGSP